MNVDLSFQFPVLPGQEVGAVVSLGQMESSSVNQVCFASGAVHEVMRGMAEFMVTGMRHVCTTERQTERESVRERERESECECDICKDR